MNKKSTVQFLCRTALLLALCVASQFLKNTSVYITGSIVNTILILATLSTGYLSGAAIALISPLTAWWISGSPIMSAFPLIVPCVMVGNLILVSCVWLFACWLKKKAPESERLKPSDARFRLVLLIGLVAATLWASLCIAFVSGLASALQVQSASSLMLVMLLAIAGCYAVFVCLWLLVSRFPSVWTLIAGMVIGSVTKALFMWLVIAKAILGNTDKLQPAAISAARTTFSVTQLLTALIGSALAFLIWLPLKKALKKA